MRQTVRLDEVRAPRAPLDSLSPADILALDQDALTLAAHYNGVLTQLKAALGTATWRDQPQDSLQSLSSFRGQAEGTLQAQELALQSQAQQLVAQAQSLTALSKAVSDLGALKFQLVALQSNLDSVTGSSGAQGQSLETLTAQVQALGTALNQQTAQLTQEIQSLALQAQSFVTASGFWQVLQSRYLVDQPMGGPLNRSNLIFTTPSPFVPSTLIVRYNGQGLRAGPAGDYVVSASLGALGYDTIRLLHPEAAPYPSDVLTASYIAAQSP